MQNKWNAVLNADVQKMWQRTMELLLVVDMGCVNWQKSLILKNVAIILWLVILIAEFGYSSLPGNDGKAHLSGNMFAGPARLFNVGATVLFCQCILYRLAVIKLTLEGHVMVTDTISGIVNERNRILRLRKIHMTRIVLIIAIAASVLFGLTAAFLFAGMMASKLLSSQSLFETGCWIFWWLFDVMSTAPVCSTTILFAAMWIMMAFNHRMDLCELMRQVEKMNAAEHADGAVTMDDVCNCYDHVVDEAITFHRFSSLMLMSLSLCAKPYFVTCLFVVNNGDNLFLTVTLFVLMMPPVLFACFLLAVAATTTSMSEKLHVLLCSLAARTTKDKRLSRHQQFRLQLMIEEVGSEETFFALRTPDGQKYTPETFLFYLIEAVLDYTLLITFNRSMN